MKYRVFWKSSTGGDLKRVGQETATLIRAFVEKKLSLDPRQGEPLKGRFKPLWRIRWRDHRIIYAFSDQELWMLVVRVAHRREAYR